MTNTPRDGAPGTTEQSPRWEGPEENRPRGYLPAIDEPEVDRDAAGENLSDPGKRDLSDAFTIGEDVDREARIRERAHHIWQREGGQHGHHERHWHEAEREIDEEEAVGGKRPPA